MGDVQAIQKFKASKQCKNRIHFLLLVRIRVNIKDSNTLLKTHSYLSYCLVFGVFSPLPSPTFSLKPSSPPLPASVHPLPALEIKDNFKQSISTTLPCGFFAPKTTIFLGLSNSGHIHQLARNFPLVPAYKTCPRCYRQAFLLDTCGGEQTAMAHPTLEHRTLPHQCWQEKEKA